MPFIRVTQGIVMSQILSDLNRQTRRLLDLERQLSTGQRVNTPSDDPLAARRAIAAQSEITANEQFIASMTSARPLLADTEFALRTTLDYIQRANELTLQGLNSTNTQEQRDQIANEVNQLIEGVLQQANSFSSGRYLFGGTRTLSEPFEATRDANGEITAVTYAGNDEDIEIEISEGIRMPINITGLDAFAPGSPSSVDILQALVQIRDNLRAGDSGALETRLGELEQAQNQVLVTVSRVGAVQRRLEDVNANLDEINVQLRGVISDNIDADLAEVLVNLNSQTNAYQAALNAAGRIIQPSLLDFLG
ncbi:MAG: flagellar hook-associated protein FlgL [Candidatus Hydrogenedentes bacterium]|nr:flagellar hook-associated protein FlgL [Candidatus Hydrogenedentota bacterium]